MLNRLEEDDGVARLLVAVDQRPLKAEPGPRIAGLGVGVSVRVCVNTDDIGRAAREHGTSVALAAGQIDNLKAANTRPNPLIDDGVAPVPIVLLGNVRQRPLSGQLKRRHPCRLA